VHGLKVMRCLNSFVPWVPATDGPARRARPQPTTFYITDHYRDYPAVLVRLDEADSTVIQQLLEDAWREAAPKTLVKTFDHSAGKER